ncbi:MAG: type II secretion system F family protein [Phycisphaerae bacterium]|nr:type II secretion system F family protein [Phycisphaerae bacterium]
MPVYGYEALDARVQPARGTVTAESAPAARALLRRQGLRPTRIDEVRPKAAVARGRFGGRSAGAVAELWRNLQVLLDAGVPLAESLAVCRKQQRGALRPIIQQVEESIRRGSGLREALASHPLWFDRLALAIVGVGESAGSLPQALRELSDYESSRERTGSQLFTALIYPAILITVGTGVVIFLSTYVVPQLIEVLESAGRSLPWPTRLLQAVSGFLIHWGWLLAAGVVLAVFALGAALRNGAMRRRLQRTLLKVPIFGDLYRKAWIARICMMLATLLKTDVRFVAAVRTVRDALPDSIFTDELDAVARGVEAGQDIAAPLEVSGLMPPLVIQMLSVGQQSGSLPDMLAQLRTGYEREVQVSQTRLLAILEPALIVGLALIIGLVVFATVLPILETTRVVQ